MIDTYLKDKKWLLKNGLCLLWSAVPVFGWFSLVFMGKKSGRKQLTGLGGIYGITSLLGLFLMNISPVLNHLAWSVNRSVSPLSRMAGSLQDIGLYLLVGVWGICLIHTLMCVKQYYQYLALKTLSAPAPSDLVTDRKWRTAQLRWMIWCWIPVLGGLGLSLAGRRMDSRKLKRSGWIITAASGAVWLIAKILSQHFYTWKRYMQDLVAVLILTVSMLVLLTAFLIREDYLRSWAQTWERDVRQRAVLKDRHWCHRNSLWQLWTILPGVGGIGIILAGRTARNRKILGTGVGLMACNILLLLAAALLDARVGGLLYTANYQLRTFLQTVLNAMHVVVWVGIFYYGALIRWDVLKARSRKLQGYDSEFQRDLDLYNRKIQASSVDTREEEKIPETVISQEKTVTTVSPVVKDGTAPAAVGRMDINTCSLEELMTLPGVGIVQAKNAIAHREQQGNFRDVEEFVHLLGIKPHFAVKVFELAEVSKQTPTHTQTSQASGRGRRLDF